MHTIINTSKGIYVCGNNSCGQLGLGHNNDEHKLTQLMTNSKIRQIVTCDNVTIILEYNDNMLGFGSNLYNKLNIKEEYINIPTYIPFDKKVKYVSGCRYHIIIFINDLINQFFY